MLGSCLSCGARWPCWAAAAASLVWLRRELADRRRVLRCIMHWLHPSYGQWLSFTHVAVRLTWRICYWSRQRGRLMQPSTPPTNARLSSKATCSQSGTPCARGQVNMRQPGVNWWLAADKTTSVQLWFFCPKGRSTSGFMIQFLRSRTCKTCMASAGALHSMANRSHGAADGGPNGSPTSSWLFHKSAPS